MFTRVLALVFAFLFSGSAYSWSLFGTEELSFEAAKYWHYYNPYYVQENEEGELVYKDDWVWRAGLNWDVVMFDGLFYWDNFAHFSSDQHQVKEVGWRFELGINPTDWLDLFYFHHSKHATEEVGVGNKYPLEDSFGLRVYFINNRDRKRRSFEDLF